MNITIKKTANPKTKPNENELGFGKIFTDHMFVADYSLEKGWHNAEVIPYAPIPLDPATLVLHYAQEVFEGMKSYRVNKDEVLLFRPEMNAKRFQTSCERICLPELPVEDFVDAVKTLVSVEKDWVPSVENSSLYIRPFMFASEVAVGIHPSFLAKFVIIASPVGNYLSNGIAPAKIYVEEELVRAVKGGTGMVKCGGNYAASITAQKKAQDLGYQQVLWLDGIEHKYVEEVGTMNVMFKIDGEMYTPSLDGSILPGITRNSAITILKDLGYKIHEQKISIDFILEAYENGKLEEAFGLGTAAVVSPIGELNYRGKIITINDFKVGKTTKELYDALTGIQWGKIEDKYNWTVKIK